MLIINTNEEPSSSSDEDPDHRCLSPWFVNLLQIKENALKLPDHGSSIQLSNLPQFYLKNYIHWQNDSAFTLISPAIWIKAKLSQTSIQLAWLKYRCGSFARFYHVLFSID